MPALQWSQYSFFDDYLPYHTKQKWTVQDYNCVSVIISSPKTVMTMRLETIKNTDCWCYFWVFIDFIIGSQFEKFKIIIVCCSLGLSKITIVGCNFLSQLSYDCRSLFEVIHNYFFLFALPKSMVKNMGSIWPPFILMHTFCTFFGPTHNVKVCSGRICLQHFIQYFS